MKLLSTDIDDRIKIDRVKLDRKMAVNDVAEVMNFGENNDYPNIIEKIVSSSVTASAIRDMNARFLSGMGFENEEINDIVIAKDIRQKAITIKDLLRQASASAALNFGVYIKTKVNAAGKIASPEVLSFKNCRFGKIDDSGYIAKVLYYDKWAKDNKNSFKGDKENNKISSYPLFDVRESVLSAQMQRYGSPEKHPGQVYFHAWENSFIYPLSPFDSIYLDADSEWQISLFRNREIRNGFMTQYIMRVANPDSEEEKRKLIEKVQSMQGPDGDRIVLMSDEIDPETGQIKEQGAFKLDKVDNNINDKLFEQWEVAIANKIRKANKAFPAMLIDYEASNLGTTSGEAISQAVSFYNAMTRDDRSHMSRMFEDIFKHSNNPVLANNENWHIKPLELIEKTL
jgi:hypothetical protein